MEADYGMTSLAMDVAENQFNRFKGDERLYVIFYIDPVRDDIASAKEGRPIFVDTEWVRIMVPGDKSNVVARPANGEDKMRFAKQYESFKSGKSEEVTQGTPLEQWPLITRAQVAELRHFNIRTVDQLAQMADTHAQKFMGINMLRQKARDWLVLAKEAAPMSAMRAELDERDSKIAALEDAVADMAEKLKERED